MQIAILIKAGLPHLWLGGSIKARVVAGVETQLMRFAGAAAVLQSDALSPGFVHRLLYVDLSSLWRMRRGDSGAMTPVVRFITLHPAPRLPQEHATAAASR